MGPQCKSLFLKGIVWLGHLKSEVMHQNNHLDAPILCSQWPYRWPDAISFCTVLGRSGSGWIEVLAAIFR